MTDIILEAFRVVIVGIIFVYLWLNGRREEIRKQKGWNYILAGFAFLFVGMILDITDNFPYLNKYLIIGDTEYEAFLEKVVGYLGGFLLLIIGFWRWMPTVISLSETKRALKKSHDELELRVQERTAILKSLNKQLTQEVNERKQTEKNLGRSEKKYRKLLETANDAIFVADAETGVILGVNKKAEDLIGMPLEKIIGMHQTQLHPREEAERYSNIFNEHIKNKTAISEEVFVVNSNGHKIPVEISVSVAEIGGKIIVQGIFRDITERKKLVEQLKVSLREKDILLKELYHRTKNNMQIISSLLNLQSLNIRDKQILQIFQETQNRIKSISLVHEKLYQSKDLSHVNLGDYVKDLAGALLRSYRTGTDKIFLKLEADSVLVSIDTVIPCGLIINELMTNILKYAFPDGNKGEIEITLHTKDDANEIELRISDNGIGLPRDFDFRRTSSLGLKLVTKLIENELGGRMDVNTETGTEFIMMFREQQHHGGVNING